MVNWYYVVGSERVGPISVEGLKQLFLNDEINLETYIWKKGFQNWERLKDVTELNFDLEEEPVVAAAPAPAPTPTPVHKPAPAPVKAIEVEETSPEINFNFDWRKVKDNDELFFVRIGRDRKKFDGSDIFGPYSQVELKEAMNEKRINFQTLIFAPGMSSWTKIQDSPLNENFKGVNQSVGLNEVPLILVIDYFPLPLVTVVKKAGTKEGILLGSGPFVELENKTVKATIYVGSEVKVRNVKVKINSYDKKDQSMDCQFVDLNQDARKIMLNHAV